MSTEKPEEYVPGKVYCTTHGSEVVYFYSHDEILAYCREAGILAEYLVLTECIPNYAYRCEPDDYYEDILPEDGRSCADVAPELAAAFAELNAYIKEKRPILSYSPGVKLVRFREAGDEA